MKLSRRTSLALLLLLAWPFGLQAAECYQYEPKKSHVPGTLKSRNIDPNDSHSRLILILVLDTPICVDGGEDPDLNVPVSGLKELQVLHKDPYRMKVLFDKKVQVDGWLFHKDSEDQVTKVLIDAKKIKSAAY